jgi:hypothetical protein
MNLDDSIVRLALALLFAGVGILASSYLSRSSGAIAWTVFALGIIGASGILSKVFAFGAYAFVLDSGLYALGLGILFGFIIRRQRSGPHVPGNDTETRGPRRSAP